MTEIEILDEIRERLAQLAGENEHTLHHEIVKLRATNSEYLRMSADLSKRMTEMSIKAATLTRLGNAMSEAIGEEETVELAITDAAKKAWDDEVKR